MHEFFNVTVGYKVPITWSEKKLESFIFEIKDEAGNDKNNNNNSKQHSAEHLKMSAKCQ